MNDNLYESMNQIIINNIVVIVDIFHSIKYNSIVFVINKPKYIFENTGINIKENMKINIDETTYTLEYIEPTDFDHIEQLNGKTFFKDIGFHMEVGIIKNMSKKTNISIEMNGSLYLFDISNDDRFINNKCLTTIHKDQYHLIPPWIDYHKKLGFEKFIIYDNNWKNNENLKLKEKYKNDIIFINANWNYWYKSDPIGQPIQQNHCIWKYCPQFLGLTDLDEYININENYLFNKKYSIISIPNTFFGCGRNASYDSYNFTEKMIYREQQHDIKSRRKCIVKTNTVDLFCVHIPITFDTNIFYLNFNDGYLNHYRQMSCNKDIICNCIDRCAIYDNTILSKMK
jgi:hypothetical protein